MGKSVEEIKAWLIDFFPKLADDKNFEITSKASNDYNCIAWAYFINNRWMWPNTGQYPFLDGVHYWPSEEILDCDVSPYAIENNFYGKVYCLMKKKFE